MTPRDWEDDPDAYEWADERAESLAPGLETDEPPDDYLDMLTPPTKEPNP